MFCVFSTVWISDIEFNLLDLIAALGTGVLRSLEHLC